MKCACCGAVSVEPVSLTPRERDVLILLCKGFGIEDIGARLVMGRHTVNDHMKEVFRKLQVGSRAEAAVLACRMGLPV